MTVEETHAAIVRVQRIEAHLRGRARKVELDPERVEEAAALYRLAAGFRLVRFVLLARLGISRS